MVSAPTNEESEICQSPTNQKSCYSGVTQPPFNVARGPEPMDTYETDPGEDIEIQNMVRNNLNRCYVNQDGCEPVEQVSRSSDMEKSSRCCNQLHSIHKSWC